MIVYANTVVQHAIRIKKRIMINANVCVKSLIRAIAGILGHELVRIVGEVLLIIK